MVKNTVKIYDNYAKIIITGKNYKKAVLVDLDDIDKLGQIYYDDSTGYAYKARPGKNPKAVHAIIKGISTNKANYVDHKNGNKLDNRRKNLSLCTSSANGRNKHSYSRNNTGTVGIQKQKDDGRNIYRAQFTTKDGKRKRKEFNIDTMGKEKAFKAAKKWLDENKKKNGYIIHSDE